jgi:phage shock protein PspC (stress-responsive transcriptional regulator)
MSGETETRASKPQSGFEETVKDFWASRPRRPHSGRKVAGVAAAIGNRYGIDPVIVRVALAVTTFLGGAGPIIYVLGWLFFPDEHDQVSAFEAMIGRGRSSSSTGFTVLLCLALIPLSGWTFSGGWFAGGLFDGGGVVGFVLFLAAIYGLHHARGNANRPAASPVAGYGSAYGQGGFDAAFSMSDTATKTADGTAPGWDPLGAAPFAWDLPDPEPAPTPATPATPQPPASPPIARPKSKVALVTSGFALVALLTGITLNVFGVDWFSPHHVIGLTLGVLGVGLVAGSFVRGGRGLIGLAIPLAIAGLITTVVPFDNIKGGFGDLHAAPTALSDVHPTYQRTAGNVTVDLSKLPAAGSVTTKVIVGAGQASVTVPETADVTYRCDASLGDVSCLGHHTSGVGTGPVTDTDLGTDGAGGLKITLDVEAAGGQVEVNRG